VPALRARSDPELYKARGRHAGAIHPPLERLHPTPTPAVPARAVPTALPPTNFAIAIRKSLPTPFLCLGASAVRP
jgi:hypothetical protein